MSDVHGSRIPDDGRHEEWNGAADAADQWVIDPVTGEYRMRIPGELLPGDPSAEPSDPPMSRTAELVLYRAEAAAPVPRSRAASRAPAPATRSRAAAPATRSRAASRTPDRRSRGKGRRRNSGSGGGLWLVGALGAVGVLGCVAGAFLLLHGGHKAATDCAAAAPSASAPAAAPDTPGPGPSAAAIDVRVTVLNGSGVFGQAEAALSWMQNTEGFLRTSNGGPAAATALTSLVYAPDHADQARTLAAAMHLPDSALHGTGTATGQRDPMVLTLGKDFKTAGKPLAAPPAPASAPASAGCAR